MEGDVVINNCSAIRATEKALLVRFEDGSEHWIPRGQMIIPETQIKAVGDRGALVVSQWFVDHARLFAAGAEKSPRVTAPSAAARSESQKDRTLENKPGRGVLFRKRAHGNQPNYEGGFNIEGVKYRLVSWIKQSKSGLEYLSLAVEPAPTATAAPNTQPVGRSAPMDDQDIPF